jgi:hypothetical protein
VKPSHGRMNTCMAPPFSRRIEAEQKKIGMMGGSLSSGDREL